MGVVYKITCVINKKVYIGQTMNYESRKYSNLFILNLQQEFNKLIKTNNKTTCYKILGDKYAISYQVISLLIRFGTTKHPSYNKSVTTISERE